MSMVEYAHCKQKIKVVFPLPYRRGKECFNRHWLGNLSTPTFRKNEVYYYLNVLSAKNMALNIFYDVTDQTIANTNGELWMIDIEKEALKHGVKDCKATVENVTKEGLFLILVIVNGSNNRYTFNHKTEEVITL